MSTRRNKDYLIVLLFVVFTTRLHFLRAILPCLKICTRVSLQHFAISVDVFARQITSVYCNIFSFWKDFTVFAPVLHIWQHVVITPLVLLWKGNESLQAKEMALKWNGWKFTSQTHRTASKRLPENTAVFVKLQFAMLTKLLLWFPSVNSGRVYVLAVDSSRCAIVICGLTVNALILQCMRGS